MPTTMSKKQKRHLQELSNRCYELELSAALNELYQNFEKWKNGSVPIWDLQEQIHQHHDGISRDLHNFYDMLRDPFKAVARGVAKGIIKMEDIQEDCHSLLERHIEYYEQQKGGSTIG